MITIDQLRALGGKPHYMGLGCVKYVFKHSGQSCAYHFYSDKAEILVEDIHEHRFGFTSTVKKGILKNYIYDVHGTDPESTLQVERGECKSGAERVVEVANANVVELCTFVTEPEQSYHLHQTTLHRIECLTPKVITMIRREPMIETMPRFITDTAKPSVCAFSQPKPVKECWEIIEYTLNDND